MVVVFAKGLQRARASGEVGGFGGAGCATRYCCLLLSLAQQITRTDRRIGVRHGINENNTECQTDYHNSVRRSRFRPEIRICDKEYRGWWTRIHIMYLVVHGYDLFWRFQLLLFLAAGLMLPRWQYHSASHVTRTTCTLYFVSSARHINDLG